MEAKATDSVNKDDFKGLVALRESLGEDFVHGFVFYTGVRSLSFGDRLTALPLSALWDRWCLRGDQVGPTSGVVDSRMWLPARPTRSNPRASQGPDGRECR